MEYYNSSIDDILVVDFTSFKEKSGSLIVAESGHDVPFNMARVFSVVSSNAVRGDHAHKECSQLLLCLYGTVEVLCDDGFRTSMYLLDKPCEGLLIPPGIWATQSYINNNNVLNVYCDKAYNSDDYIHQYSDFLHLKKYPEFK